MPPAAPNSTPLKSHAASHPLFDKLRTGSCRGRDSGELLFVVCLNEVKSLGQPPRNFRRRYRYGLALNHVVERSKRCVCLWQGQVERSVNR